MMRRKFLLYPLAALAVVAVLWACQRDRFGHDDPTAVQPSLTVGEARDFFEYQMAEAMPALTKLPGDRPTGMLPGDFTPLWDKARIGANPEMDGADVPIDPKFIFTAVFNRITPEGESLRQMVDVTQKLVVKKWRDTSDYQAFCYIASIVPTPEYYARHKNVAQEFRYGGSKGEFSGFVVYRTLEGVLVAIDNFRDGQRTRHDYFPKITAENQDNVARVAEQAMTTTEFQGGTPTMFRTHVEEDMVIETEDVTVVGPKPNPFPDRPTGLPDPLPDPIDPGYGGGGGGGGGGNPSTPTVSVPQIQQKDCGGAAGQNAAGAQSIYGAFNNAGLQDFINSKISDDKEWGVALNYNSQSGTYAFGLPNYGETGTGNVGIPTTYGTTVNTTALFHTHPRSEQPQSVTDVIGLIQINQDTRGQTPTSIVAIRKENAPPIIYAIQIEDKISADAFAGMLKNNDNLKLQMTNELTDINGKILQAGGTMDESYAYAMSHLLNKYNAGVKILKCENGNFKQKEATVNNNTITRSTCK